MARLKKVLPVIAMVAFLVGLWWWSAQPVGVHPAGSETEVGASSASSASLGGRSRSMLDGEDKAVVDGVMRRVVPHRIRVVDAGSGRAIGGAVVRLFSAADDELASTRCNAEGYAELPRTEIFEGYAVTADGYQATAAESTETVIRMTPLRFLVVETRGAVAGLMANYRLLVALEFGEQRYPGEFARRVAALLPGAKVELVSGRCELILALRAPGLVRLYGVHRGTGKVAEFDKQEVAADQDLLVFDCRRYAVPTGNWLRLQIVPPRHVGEHASLNARIELLHQGRWTRWARRSVSMRGDGQVLQLDFVELRRQTYRVEIELYSGDSRGHALLSPFRVKGGVTRRIDLRSRGEATLTVRFSGPSRRLYNSERLKLVGAKGVVSSVALNLGNSTVRFINVAAGRYRIESSPWGTFTPPELVMVPGQSRMIDITPIQTGFLRLIGLAPEDRVIVRDLDRQRQVPPGVLSWRNRGRQASLPVGSYRIEVGGRAATQVVVRAGENVLWNARTGRGK